MMRLLKKLLKKIIRFYVSVFKYVGKLAGAAAISAVIMIPLVYATSIIISYYGYPEPKITDAFIDLSMPLGILAAMMFMVGLVEETLYRYFIQDCLLQKVMKWKKTPAIIFAAIWFGLAHFANAYAVGIDYMVFLPQVIGAAAAGLWFGYLYERCGLHFAILTHGLYDFAVVCGYIFLS